MKRSPTWTENHLLPVPVILQLEDEHVVAQLRGTVTYERTTIAATKEDALAALGVEDMQALFRVRVELAEHRKKYAHITREEYAAETGSLRQRIAELEAALNRVKTHCAGDAMPRWDCTPRTTASRGYIMDVCDAALSGGGE